MDNVCGSGWPLTSGGREKHLPSLLGSNDGMDWKCRRLAADSDRSISGSTLEILSQQEDETVAAAAVVVVVVAVVAAVVNGRPLALAAAHLLKVQQQSVPPVPLLVAAAAVAVDLGSPAAFYIRPSFLFITMSLSNFSEFFFLFFKLTATRIDGINCNWEGLRRI